MEISLTFGGRTVGEPAVNLEYFNNRAFLSYCQDNGLDPDDTVDLASKRGESRCQFNYSRIKLKKWTQIQKLVDNSLVRHFSIEVPKGALNPYVGIKHWESSKGEFRLYIDPDWDRVLTQWDKDGAPLFWVPGEADFGILRGPRKLLAFL